MTINTIKFSQFAAGSLANANFAVGVTSLSGGTNYQIPATNVWTTGTRPVTPLTGTIGFNTSLSQVEYWNGAAWVQLSAGGSGTVGMGAAGQVAYYQFSGTAVVGTNTIPNTVATQGITNGTAATAGNIGELMQSIVLSTSAIGMTSGISQTITSITLTAGDWNVWGNVGLTDTTGTGDIANINMGISTTDNALPSNTVFETNIISQSQFYAQLIFPVPMIPANITMTTTYYLIGNAFTIGGSLTGFGAIYARRVR